MSGLGCRTRLAFGTRRRNFAKASLGSFKVNPRLRLGLTLNSPRLALYVTIAGTPEERRCLRSPLRRFPVCFWRPPWSRVRASVIRQLNRGLLQKTQTSKLPNLTTCARTPFWSFCAGQRRIGPGQITDGT